MKVLPVLGLVTSAAWVCQCAGGLIFASLLAACDRAPNEAARPQLPPAAVASQVASSAPRGSAPPPAPAAAGASEGDAKIPFDFPAVTLTVGPGAFVLAPPRAWVDAALEKGADRQTFIYYGGWLRAVGRQASEIETLTGQHQVLPNSLIVAMPQKQRVRPGQVVLTAWARGTGMQRAMVVEGGSEASPVVRYLDMSVDSPTGWGEREDTLPKDTFVVLDDGHNVGRTAACKEGAHRMRYIVTQQSGDRLLGYGFAGKVAAFGVNDCVVLPLKPRLNEGDWVSVPVSGRYTRSKVRRVDVSVGRVWTKYRSDGDDQVTAFAVIDVALNLE